MAINPITQYPLKMDPISAPEWPYGEPRNISAAGAGDGTPWELAAVKDLMGLQQAILIKAGITPTGNPDNADESQYLDGLSVICGRQVSSTTAALTLKLPSVTGIRSLGYLAKGDGGGGLWTSTGVTSVPDAGTFDLPAGFLYDADGRQFELVPGDINPRELGAKGDGITDDQPAFQAACTLQAARGGGVIRITRGTYLQNAQVTVGDKMTWQGDAGGASVISYVGAAGTFTNNACIYAAGSSAAIPDLNADLAPDATQIVFAAPHTLANDDLFYISDPRANSYGSDNAAYRAGEFCVATEVVDPTTVELQSPVYATTNPAVNTTVDTYDAAQVDCLKVAPVRVALRDLTIIGISDASTLNVVSVDFGRSCRFEGLHISNSLAGLLRIAMSFDTVISDLQMNNSQLTATHNGVVLLYCQQVLCDKIRGGGGYSMISLSADAFITDGVVNREVYISNCIASQQGTIPGSVWCQQNSEHVNVSNSRLAGVVFGGDHHRVSNCEIEAWAAGANCILLKNMTGCDVQVSDCSLALSVTITGGLIQWDDAAPLDRPSTVRIVNVTIKNNGFTGDPITFRAQGGNDTGKLKFYHLSVLGQNSTLDICFINALASSGWAEVSFDDCSFLDTSIAIASIEKFTIERSTLIGSPLNALRVDAAVAPSPYAAHNVNIHECRIFEANFAGVSIVDPAVVANCSNTISLRNNQDVAKFSSRSSFVMELPVAGGELNLYNNVFGDDGSPSAQSWAYHYSNVNNVRDIRTAIVGGTLPVVRTAIINEEIALTWTDAGDKVTGTGRLGVAGADPAAAPTGADELAIGDIGTGSHGMYIQSGPTGASKIVAGDSTTAERFTWELDHTNDLGRMTVKATDVFEWTETEVKPASTGSIESGLPARRWKNVYGGGLFGKRVFLDDGTVLTPGSDVSISAGWGTTATVTGSSRGRDAVLQVVINSLGTGQLPNPTFTYTYPDGATAGSKSPIAQVTPFGSVNSNWQVVTESSTAIGVRFIGTPSAGVDYGCNVLLIWDDD